MRIVPSTLPQRLQYVDKTCTKTLFGEEVEAKSGQKEREICNPYQNDVITVKKCVVNGLTLDTPIPPMDKGIKD